MKFGFHNTILHIQGRYLTQWSIVISIGNECNGLKLLDYVIDSTDPSYLPM